MEKRAGSQSLDVTISWSTILKLFAAGLIAAAIIRLSRFIELVALAVLIAIALRPLFLWALRHKWPKWTGVTLCAVVLFGTTAILLGIIVPSLFNEGTAFAKNLPEYKTNLMQHLPASGPVRNVANEMLGGASFSNPEPLLKKIISWSGSGLELLAGFVAVLVLAVYFISDGSRVYDWISAFLPKAKRAQLNDSIDEITSVVSHYVGGSMLTAMICGIYAFTVLTVLRVPNAVLLAVVAGVFDLLPIIGFFIFAFPSVLVAFTVSPKTALMVFVLYGAYHLTEAYFIVPKVYGNRLRLSGLTVLLCCLSAGLIGGVIAILLVLPMVACYPIAERIWMKSHLDPETLQKHHAMDRAAHSHAKTGGNRN